jgi:hypothetical protein
MLESLPGLRGRSRCNMPACMSLLAALPAVLEQTFVSRPPVSARMHVSDVSSRCSRQKQQQQQQPSEISKEADASPHNLCTLTAQPGTPTSLHSKGSEHTHPHQEITSRFALHKHKQSSMAPSLAHLHLCVHGACCQWLVTGLVCSGQRPLRLRCGCSHAPVVDQGSGLGGHSLRQGPQERLK